MPTQHCILVVEDEQTLRRLLEYQLSKEYDVITAANGEEAIAAMEDRVPDLIISDIMMPKMDGFQLQKAVSDRDDTKDVPFIFLTAKADEQSRTKGLREGVDEYMSKPFDIDYLLARIDRLISRAEKWKNTLPTEVRKTFDNSLQPVTLPDVKNYRLAYRISQREAGGGDLFYFTETPDGDYLLVVADVMGKGVQAKFNAYAFFGYVQSIAKAGMEEGLSPAALMKRLNELLLQDVRIMNTHASMLIILWDPKANLITYTNAGHCRPIVVTPSGAYILEHSDLIVGLQHNAEFIDTEVLLPENAAFLAYTDGLTEQPIGDEIVGESRVLEAAARAYRDDVPIDALMDLILKESSMPKWQDDILVFWLQRTGLNWFTPFEISQS